MGEAGPEAVLEVRVAADEQRGLLRTVRGRGAMREGGAVVWCHVGSDER